MTITEFRYASQQQQECPTHPPQNFSPTPVYLSRCLRPSLWTCVDSNTSAPTSALHYCNPPTGSMEYFQTATVQRTSDDAADATAVYSSYSSAASSAPAFTKGGLKLDGSQYVAVKPTFKISVGLYSCQMQLRPKAPGFNP